VVGLRHLEVLHKNPKVQSMTVTSPTNNIHEPKDLSHLILSSKAIAELKQPDHHNRPVPPRRPILHLLR
jgi:hypothetical protein